MFWIIAIIILAVMLQNPEQPFSEKKNSVAEWGKVGMGIFMIAGGAVALLSGFGVPAAGPLIAGGALVAFGGVNLFKGIAGLFTPDVGIPWYVWVGAIIVLIMIVKKKKD